MCAEVAIVNPRGVSKASNFDSHVSQQSVKPKGSPLRLRWLHELARMAPWCFQLDSMCRVAEGKQHVEGVAHSMLLCTMLNRHHV